MGGYKGNLGSSPLDGVVNFIDGVRHGGRNAKQKAKDIASAPKRKVQAAVSGAKPDMCKKLGHKGKRGKMCERDCGTKLL